MPQPFQTWQALVHADRSAFFKGHSKDTAFDQSTKSTFSPSSDALFTQSNARVLLGHAANGVLRLAALPTQVYPAPTGTGEFGLGPGMYHHFDVAMYAGSLTYQIDLEGGPIINVGAEERENETTYAAHFIPLTSVPEENMEITTLSFAPVAADASKAPLSPAPLPGPAGAFHILVLKNTSQKECKGKVALLADDLLIGNYEDAAPELRDIKKPEVDLRQHTLILSRPEGSVGIHLHQGKWINLTKPFRAECSFILPPGEELVFETHIAMGACHQDVMPVIYELHMRSALDWLNLTASYWLSRLGCLEVAVEGSDDGEYTRDLYLRCLFDNFNCLQTDAQGNLIAHWQGAPSHGYGTVWGIDVEPTAISVVHLCPEIARQAMIFFMTRSRAPKGSAEHSIPILVAPVVIARQWLQVTSDRAFLETHPQILDNLRGIMDDLKKLKSPAASLYPSRYSSDGAVGRRYDYGTNAKVHYAFDSMAYILEQLERREEAENFRRMAEEIRDAISKHMLADGPFGIQITGGTNLGEDPGNFYLPEVAFDEKVFYYDGEDTSSMLAPIYGVCNQNDPAWRNYHRFARSMWCPNFDKEFGVLMWTPNEPGIFDGTGFFSRLGGSVFRQEMMESLNVMRQNGVDEVTGSVFWWPHGQEYKRSLTRCSQGQGAWAWQYLEQWLGLKVDAAAHTLILAPGGLPDRIRWEGFTTGSFHFDIFWEENSGRSTARVVNKNDTPWTIQAGFRAFGSGAGSRLRWRIRTIDPGELAEFSQITTDSVQDPGVTRAAMISKEMQEFGENGFVFKRYGPAQLWGHWNDRKLWDMQAMPLCLRFAILNDTGEDWSNLQVVLTCPDGWTAQGRRPRHWDPADALTPGKVKLDLGDLKASAETVAPFWVLATESIKITMVWWNESVGPFHQASQPGEGIVLFTLEAGSETEVSFTAELIAQTRSGKAIQRVLEIPVKVVLKDRT